MIWMLTFLTTEFSDIDQPQWIQASRGLSSGHFCKDATSHNVMKKSKLSNRQQNNCIVLSFLTVVIKYFLENDPLT